MFTLIADRFVCNGQPESSPVARGVSLAALDLATGDRVRLRIAAAQTRADQQAWVESCARAYGAGTLVDFGFIGRDRRFEAVSLLNDRRGPRVSSPPAAVLDWIDNYKPSSTRVLRLKELPDARDLRLRGFVPIRLSLLHDSSLSRVWAILGGRSVVLLDSYCAPRHLALAMLKFRDVHVSDMCALSRQPESACAAVANAAEGRAAYEPAPVIGSARAAAMLADGEGLRAAGRHAGAERSLRAAIAAFDRRDDAFHAGEAEMSLGRLLLTRGRATHARAMFESAHNRFQRVGAALPALVATVELGIAQTDLKLFSEAERSCRAAHSAASALLDADATLQSVIALARTLFWQERYAEAQAVVESAQPAIEGEPRARYWCLVARLRLAKNDVTGAWRAVGQARPASRGSTPAIECLVRTWEAAVQARLGDLEALEIHTRAGLAAARAAHLPLRAIKLRLTRIEGYIDADNLGRARAVGTHLRALSDASLPPLLKLRVARALARANGIERRDRSRSTTSAHEAAVGFHSRLAGATVDDLDGVSELLSLSHQYEDETEALSRAAASIRKHTHALAVGIFGCVEGETRPLGSAGAANTAIARRSFDAGMAVGPETSAGGVDAGVPIRYLGRPVGALAMRWTVEGPEQADRAIAFCSAAAATCAPLVYVLLERQRAPARDDPPFDLIGSSAAMNDVRQAVRRAASAPFTVLIEGECGSGKELVANAIHRAGCRRDRRFCAFNCAAMPEDLVDAELFGHAKGAFTGATGERLGLFESADGGTVFLDEVGELSARAQAKILRVLQEGEIRRIGENFTRRFDARLVAATNRSLRAEVDAGRFRQDLLYRLDVIRIVVPPLRERVEDIPLLASRFWRQSAERIGSKAVLGQSAISALARYDWPGNVRELQNVLTALVVAVPSRGVVGASQMPAAIARAAQPASHESLESARVKFEQRFVRAALARAAGHRGHTAAALGLSRQGLAKLMQRLHLDV